MIPQYIQEIIQAGKFLEEHLDWRPPEEDIPLIQYSRPDRAIGLIVEMLSGPDW